MDKVIGVVGADRPRNMDRLQMLLMTRKSRRYASFTRHSVRGADPQINASVAGTSQTFLFGWSEILTVAVGTLVLVAAFLLMRWQPISTDEIDFFLAAADWPTFRHKIPHTQGYVHLIQLSFLTLGKTVDAARLTSLFSNLATTAMLPLLTSLVFSGSRDRRAVRRAGIVATLAFAISPFTWQSSMLIDIDNGLLTTTTTGLLLVWLKLEHSSWMRRAAALAGAFAVAMWVKETTPVVVMGALLCCSLAGRSWQDVKAVVLGGVAGFLLLLASHSLYSLLTGYTILDSARGLLNNGSGLGSALQLLPDRLPQNIGVFAAWIGVPFAALLLAVTYDLLRNPRSVISRPDFQLTVTSFAVFAAYAILFFPAWGFPRYQFPAWPLLILVASGFATQGWPRDKSWIAVAIAVAGLSFVYVIVLLGDPLAVIYRATFETVSVGARLGVGVGMLLKALPPVLGAVAVGLALTRGSGQQGSTWVPLLACMFGFWLATDVIQVSADYSTRYRYGAGYADRQLVIDAVKANVPPNGYILADKDVLYFVGRPGEEIYGHICAGCKPEALIELLGRPRVDAIVWAEKEWLKAPGIATDVPLNAVFRECFAEKKQGIFTLLIRSASSACPLPALSALP